MTDNIQNTRVDREEQVSVHKHAGYQQQRQVVKNVDASRRTTISRITQLIWLFLGILEAFIGLRVLLKLIAANPANPLAKLVYGFSELFLWPFQGLTIEPSAEGMVLEIPAIIAMLVYALIGWAIVRLVWLVFYQPASRSVRTVEHKDFD
jgi:hypothetical protein